MPELGGWEGSATGETQKQKTKTRRGKVTLSNDMKKGRGEGRYKEGKKRDERGAGKEEMNIY